MSDYTDIKDKLARGWNTWNTRSVLSHVLLPEGFAINLAIKEYRGGSYLKEALIGKFGEGDEQIIPGPHAYDGSYTELMLVWKGLKVKIQTAVKNNDFVALITPLENQIYPATLVIETGMLWNKLGSIIREDGRIIANMGAKEIAVYCTGDHIVEKNIATQTPYLSVRLDCIVGVSTGMYRDIGKIEEIILEAGKRHEDGRKKFGRLGETYNAMQSCMAWDTIYEPEKDRVITPVSRLWNISWGGYVLFCWDNYFAAYIASLENRELAYANAIEVTREKTEAGFIPNFAAANGCKSYDRSQPPVGSMVVRELYRKYRDKWFLEELFEDLYRWNSWFFENRQIEEGLMTWGSNPYKVTRGNYWESEGVNGRFGAALESGLDNSPMYDGIPFDEEKHLLKLADAGLTGLFIMDCDALADIAHILGREYEKTVLEKRSGLCSGSLRQLWEDTTGIFLNKRTDTNEFSKSISPTNFYPLFCNSVEQEQVNRMVKEHFYNPEEFWGEWILPSITRNDPAYPEQNYWRGRIWAPMNFLVYLALRKHGQADACRDLAEKSNQLLLKEWLEHGHVHENYSADSGAGCGRGNSDKFYHWGGLLGLIALMEEGYVEGPEKGLQP